MFLKKSSKLERQPVMTPTGLDRRREGIPRTCSGYGERAVSKRRTSSTTQIENSVPGRLKFSKVYKS